MSFEKAMQVLTQAEAKDQKVETIKPGADPDKATPVDKLAQVEPEKKVEEPKKEEPEKNIEKPKEEEKREEPVGSRFAALAKKEKALVREQQRIKAKEDELNRKLQAVENFEKFKQEAKSNPELALSELGLTYDEITNYKLTGKIPVSPEKEVQSVREELRAWKEEQELKEKQRIEQAQLEAKQAAQQTIDEFKQEIGDYITKNSEKYELISTNEATHLVYNTIEEYFEKEKRILSLEEASDMVEEFLMKQVEKNLALKKFKARVAPQPTKEEMKPSPNTQQRTITNDMTASAPSFLPAKSEQERMQRALAHLSKQ